jgi:hypothetical protein
MCGCLGYYFNASVQLSACCVLRNPNNPNNPNLYARVCAASGTRSPTTRRAKRSPIFQLDASFVSFHWTYVGRAPLESTPSLKKINYVYEKCVCMYVCVYACMCTHMYVCIHVCMYAGWRDAGCLRGYYPFKKTLIIVSGYRVILFKLFYFYYYSFYLLFLFFLL